MTSFAQLYSESYYSTTYSNDYDIFPFIMIGLWAGIIAYIVQAIFLGMIFKKAGQPAWKAWIPIYNVWTLLQLGGQNGIWAVLALIPIVNIVSAVFMYIAMYYIGKKLGKSDLFVLWGIFLPFVWLIWLAVDRSTWQGAKPSRSSK